MKVSVTFIVLLMVLKSWAEDERADTAVRTFTSAERRLTDHLLVDSNYSSMARPVDAWDKAVPVTFGISIINLIYVNEKKGFVSMNVWYKMGWKDLQLTWDPAKFDDISQIYLPITRLWKPDITLFNSGGEYSDQAGHHLKALVYPSGDVYWVPPVTLSSTCELKMKHFPYDSHHCQLKFGSWVYDVGKLNLTFGQKDTADQENYVEHSEWKLTQKQGERNEIQYACCKEKYADITFKFILERKSQYYMCSFTTPALFIAFLIPFLFVLDHRNKFPLGAGMMVSLTILMEMLAEKIPTEHSEVPILAQYYAGLFGMLTLAFILGTFTSNIAHKSEHNHNPPEFLRRLLVGCIGRLVCVRPSNYSVLEPPPTVTMQTLEKLDTDQDPTFIDHDRSQIVPPSSRRSVGGRLQWKLMAIVLDRVFFIIFLAGVILFSITVVSH